MAKDSFRIYIWMLDTIQRYGRITLADLKDKWRTCSANDGRKELAPRTFANYKENIEQIFGIEIACDRATNEYYIVNETDLGGTAIRDWMLNSLSLRNMLHESAGLHERIVIENVPSSHRFLTLVMDAMRDNRKLVLHYKGYSMNDYEDMTVHPYSIRLFKRRWYLIGYSEYSKGMRIYMLDRADDARILGEPFDMPKEFDAEAFFEEFHGVHPSRSEKVCVKVKFLSSKRDLVRTIPLHSTQKEIETTSSYSVFEYYLRPNFDFKQEILSYMNSAEVLEPAALRKELASILLDMYKLYRSDLVKA